MSITICCPSKRPENISRLMNNIPSSVEVIFGIEEENEKHFSGFNYVVCDYDNLADIYNSIALKASGDILMISSDDIDLSPGWNEIVELYFSRYPDNVLVAHGNDGSVHGLTFGSHPFVGRSLYEQLGYLAYPGLSRYIDSWINLIGNNLKRKQYLPMRNIHWGKNKEIDEVTKKLNEKKNKDLNFYYSFKENVKEICSKIKMSEEIIL